MVHAYQLVKALANRQPSQVLAILLIAAAASAFAYATGIAPASAQEASPGICERTSEVSAEIVARIDNISDCGDVTAEQLTEIIRLNLNDQGITELQSGDFAGLTNLQHLDLSNNQLTTLGMPLNKTFSPV